MPSAIEALESRRQGNRRFVSASTTVQTRRRNRRGARLACDVELMAAALAARLGRVQSVGKVAPLRTKETGVIGSSIQSARQPKALPANSRPPVSFRMPIAPYEMAVRRGRLAAVAETPAKARLRSQDVVAGGRSARGTVEKLRKSR